MSMMPTLLDGSEIPRLVYGTAQRDRQKPPPVSSALRLGYRAIDTALTGKFHNEASDGEVLHEFLALPHRNGEFSREALFVQTKFALPSSQGTLWPYDIADDTTSRVFKSVLASSYNLKVDVIDVYFLLTPLTSIVETLQAWQAMEQVFVHGGTRYLGICNVTILQLGQLWQQASVKPLFVQNWLRKTTAYDVEVVRFCRENGIVYQAFGLFDNENVHLLNSACVKQVSTEEAVTQHQALLRLILAGAKKIGLRLCILDGSTSEIHMKENLDATHQLEAIAGPNVQIFLSLLGWI